MEHEIIMPLQLLGVVVILISSLVMMLVDE